MGNYRLRRWRVPCRQPQLEREISIHQLIQALFARKIARGQFRFGKCANAARSETRDEPDENLCSGEGIWKGAMAPYDVDVEPITKSAQAVAGQVRIGQTRERTYVERSRNLPSETGARIFTIDDGKIVANIVTNDDCIVDSLIERGDDVAEFRSTPQVLLGNAMNFRGRSRNGELRTDEKSQRPLVRKPEPTHSQNGNLNNPRCPRVEARGLCINRDSVERHQRRGARIHDKIHPRNAGECWSTTGQLDRLLQR